MNDRQLLESAAKAAGIDLQEDICSTQMWIREKPGDLSGLVWNPLTDDGDALRLAVKLGMTVNVEADIGAVCATAGWIDGACLPEAAGTEALGADPYAATRRAIVRAAAALGEQA